MKIALSGTSGTGKSTLAKEISIKYNIPLIPEFAREVSQEMGCPDIRKMTPDQSCFFQNRILERKIEEENKYSSFISDRSTADNLAYYLRWCSRDINDKISEPYVKICLSQLKTYDHIFILPWDLIPPEDDGFRSVKLYYRYEIHCLILGIIQDQGIKYEFLNIVDLQERVKFLKKFFIP